MTLRTMLHALSALDVPDRHPRDPDDVESQRTPGHYCDYLGRHCPPFCAAALGGCGADDEDATSEDELHG